MHHHENVEITKYPTSPTCPRLATIVYATIYKIERERWQSQPEALWLRWEMPDKNQNRVNVCLEWRRWWHEALRCTHKLLEIQKLLVRMRRELLSKQRAPPPNAHQTATTTTQSDQIPTRIGRHRSRVQPWTLVPGMHDYQGT
jgi:hypothetical protein